MLHRVSLFITLCEYWTERARSSIVEWLLRVQQSAKMVTARLLHLPAWVHSIPHHDVEQMLVKCATQQTCKLHVLTLTTNTATGFQDIQNPLVAQIKTHLLFGCARLPMLNLAVLHHATLLHLCPIPRHYHHDHVSYWLPCIRMSRHIIWASVHSRTSDIAMTWSGAVPSNVKSWCSPGDLVRVVLHTLRYLSNASLFAMVRAYEQRIGMLESRSDFQPAYPVYMSCPELS